jgi:hypothetical protein
MRADAGGGASDGVAGWVPVSPGVGCAADDVGGDPDGATMVLGAGLAADAQAATSRPTTIVVAKHESGERIRCPPAGQRVTRRTPYQMSAIAPTAAR